MATIKRFEEIKAWQEARELAKLVYTVARGIAIAKDYGLKDQIQRAAVGVGSNIAEGFARMAIRSLPSFFGLPKAVPLKFSLNFTPPRTSAIFPMLISIPFMRKPNHASS